jgi:hypothetical protein
MIRNQFVFKRILTIVFSILICSVSKSIYAATYDELLNSYKAYYIDVDGDGLKDIYLKSQPQIIIIIFDPDIPIDINDKPNYFLKAGSVWGDYASPIEWTGAKPNLQNAVEQNILAGNTDNVAGTTELLIQSAEQGKSSVIISFVGFQPQNFLYEAELSLIEGQDISSEVSSIALNDSNADGRDDLTIKNILTGSQFSLISNADGTFGETVTEEEVDVRKTWFGLQSALKQKDITSAITYFSARRQDNYAQIFADLKDDLPTIVQEFHNFYRLDVSDEIALFSINRNIDGENRLFFITFVKDSDAKWVIESL